MTTASFKGTTDQQVLAEEIFRLMTTQGALFASDAPIKQSLANLAEFLAPRHSRDRAQFADEIDAALRANEEIFSRQEAEGEVLYITSRQGRFSPRIIEDTHTFKQRLHDPEHPLPIDDISVVVSTSRPAITTVEPVFISDYWKIQAGMAPVATPAAEELAPVVAEAPAAVMPEPAVVEPEPVVVEPEPAAVTEAPAIAEPEPAVVEPEPVVAEPEPVVAAAPAVPQPVVEPVVPATPAVPTPTRSAPGERSATIVLPDGTPVDLRRPLPALLAEHGALLESILAERIEQDPLRRIVSFGRSLYPEASMISLGKNDLRKIRDYILERNEPLLDTEIIADLYYHNPRQPDYEGFRFSLNYRLHREKDFEFVGVEGARLWSTKGLPAIGGKRVKAAEMGQITSYLVEGYDDSLENNAANSTSTDRLLTFFEWEYGVLPLDARLAALLPSPMLPDQRTAVLRFESPQHYSSYLVEVRYPTGNRGGWLQGLEEFFHEHLVPGARITIAQGSEPNLFQISYEEAGETSDRLITLDEKKNKLGFANLTFYCAVDESQLPSQSRFGRLNRLKSFPMGERRKAEMILEHVVETMGDQTGSRSEPRYTIGMGELLVAYNVLRPGSKALLRALIAGNEDFSVDAANPEQFVYTPTLSDSGEAESAEEGEDEEVQPTRRRSGRYFDDDE